RLIPPPYSPQRMQSLAPYQTRFPAAMGQITFYGGRGRARLTPVRLTTAIGDLWSAVESVTVGEDREIEIAIGLEDIKVDGDWSVRHEASIERRVEALQSILRQATEKDIMAESRPVIRDVLVAKGRWNFVPVELRPGVSA